MKEQKKCGQTEVQLDELKNRLRQISLKSNALTTEKGKSASKSCATTRLLEKEIYKRDQELVRLREIIKHQSFGFSQKFETDPNFSKFFQLHGITPQGGEAEDLIEIIHNSKLLSKELIDDS